jgi:hypothetical protein
MANLRVSVLGEEGQLVAAETRAVDMSARGVAILMDRPLELNTLVELVVKRSGVRAWAVVRSNRSQRHTGRPVVGLEYVGGVPPHATETGRRPT